MTLGNVFRTLLATAAFVTAGLASANAQPVTLKIWMHEHPPRIPIDKSIVAEFEKANPDIKLDYQVIGPADYPTKLLTAFASGGGPDIFNQSLSLIAQYQAARILAPIDYAALGYADEKALTAAYVGGFDGIRFAGKLYGIPTEVSNYACYTNNKMWQAAGLDPKKDFPKTWEALPAVAEKLTIRDASGAPKRRGFDFDWPSAPAYWITLSSLMHQRGVDLVDEDTYKSAYDSPAGLKVSQFMTDLVNKYKLGGPQYTDSRTDFLNGNVAFDCSFGIWGIPQMHDAKIDFSVFPAPRFQDAVRDQGFDAYAYYMMVNARSPAPAQKAAWKFVRFYTDHAVALFKGAGLFVPRPDVMALTSDPDSQVFLTELKKAKIAPRVAGYGQAVDALIRGRDRMMQGAEPVASVVPAVSADLDAILKRERARAEASRK